MAHRAPCASPRPNIGREKRVTSGADDLSPVSVVICTHLYARRESLEAALESIAGQSLPPRETFVVVDGDVLLACYLRDRIAPEQLVVLQQRSGLSAARNAGVSRVTAPLVAFSTMTPLPIATG